MKEKEKEKRGEEEGRRGKERGERRRVLNIDKAQHHHFPLLK